MLKNDNISVHMQMSKQCLFQAAIFSILPQDVKIIMQMSRTETSLRREAPAFWTLLIISDQKA